VVVKLNRFFLFGVVFFSVLFSIVGNAQTQALEFERINTQKWFSQSSISCHTQDPDGYIWFGTSNGLYRFDGYGVKAYKHDTREVNSLAHNNVNAVYADKNGFIWIGTWGGVNRLNPKTNEFVRYKHDPKNTNSLSFNDVRAIEEDLQGNLWLGTFGGGIVRFSPKTQSFKAFQYSSRDAGSVSSNFINVIKRDRNGDLWIGTRRGINKLETENERFTNFQNLKVEDQEQLSTNISCIIEDFSGNIWFGTFGGGLMHLDRRSAKIRVFEHNIKDNSGVSSNYIHDLSITENGNIWIATSEGLNILDPQTDAITYVLNDPSKPNSLINNDVLHLFRDRSGVTWIVTAEGINLFSRLNGRFRKIQRIPDDPGSISSNNITCFLEQEPGMLWIGTRDGLNLFNSSSRKFIRFSLNNQLKGESISNEIKSMLFDKQGRFWIGTSNSLLLIEPQSGKINRVYRFDSFNPNSLNNEIHTLYQTLNGEIWAGNRKGLLKFYPDSGRFELFRPDRSVADNQITNSVYCITEDRFGRLWAGTLGGGLVDFDRKTNTFKTFKKIAGDTSSLSHNSVISICEDQLGFFWIGTFGGGLNRLDRKTGKFTLYTARDGLPDDMVYAIIDDKKGGLWISTSSGLARFDTKTRKFRNYDVQDGLQSKEFNIGSGVLLSSGEMIFGGIAGMNWFYPDEIPGNNFLPPIVITSFKVFDKEMNLSESVELPYNQNFFSFEFSSLSFALADKNRFAYMLEGFDENWVYSGDRRFASYSNLSPGEYTFHVKGSNSDGLWNEKGAEIRILIKRPYWKTWWFIALICILGLTVVYGSYRYRIRNIQKQQRILEEKVVLRTSELEKATHEAETARVSAENASRAKSGFLANMSHEIRTPLNGILGFTDLLIRNQPTEENRKYLELIRSSGDTLLRLLSDILDLNKIEQGKLTIENIRFRFAETIQQTLLPYQYRSNEKGLSFTMQFDKRIPDFIIGDPTRIKQLLINLVSNSIKFTEQGGIAVLFEVEQEQIKTGDYFYIRGMVTDTGIGVPEDKQKLIFDTFTQADGSFTRKYGGSGLGLSIVKQLCRLMQGDIRLISPAIEKPIDTENPGATFVFRFKVEAASDSEIREAEPNSLAGNLFQFRTQYRVLLVEDNKINQLLASTILENFGFEVITADDGLQGLEKIKEEDFDLVLMDVQMPVMDGYESTQAMRALGISLPIIGLTANVYKEDIDKCIEAGMNSHLGKPFTEADLYGELKKWLA
jgi:signal transduction histidine kinase/ligand-binding sensor domain-containing protein/CheY-like chemotaxis protein